MTPRRIVCLVAAILGLAASVAIAQDKPAVFVHGLKSSGDAWEGAAGRLAGQLAIEPHTPDLSWSLSYETQASELHGRYWWLPASTIAIGHSNGGVVARQWSRRRPLGGIVTLGSPNQGAPLVGNLPLVGHYQSVMGWLVADVTSAFSRCCDRENVWPTIEWWMAVTYWMGSATLEQLLVALGVSAAAPVLPEMVPSSGFLRDLNGSNATREASETPARVAIVSTAANFYDLGIFGAVFGNNADYFNEIAEATVWALDFYAMHILASAGPYDSQAHTKANRLWNLAAWIDSWDEAWCRAVSSPGGAFCAPNDSVVPAWSQVLPGPGAHVLDWGWFGPLHTSQTSSSDDKLYQALTSVMHVPARTAASGGSGGSATNPGGSSAGTLGSGGALYPGQSLWSPNLTAQLVYQQDGNLVLYRRDGTPLWASHTAGTAPGDVVMQWDGNLVIYDQAGHAVWASQTAGHERARLSVQDDGVMVIRAEGGAPLWSTGW